MTEARPIRPSGFTHLVLSERTRAFARDLTAVILGLDDLYRKDQAAGDDGDNLVSREGLVAVNLSAVPPKPLATWTEAKSALGGLSAEAPDLPEADRRLYYQELIGSLTAIVDWRTEGLAFPEQVARLLCLPGQAIPETTLAGYRDELGRILRDQGFSGDVASQVRAWEDHSAVTDDHLEETFAELQREGRRRTGRLFDLPETAGLDLVMERGVSYSAYCDYVNRQMRINVDQRYTMADMKHLIGHEIFPGHYTHLLIRETMAHEGLASEDVNLVVTDTAGSATFEGIAEQGLVFLDWVDGPDDVIGSILRRLRSAAACNASWQLHTLGRSPEDVAEYLRTVAIGDEGWVRARMRFIGYPLRAPFVFSYWYGDQAVERAWRLIPVQHRQGFLAFLYTRLHSPRSMEHFSPLEA